MTHPGRLTWFTYKSPMYIERKRIFQTSMIILHVNLQGCNMYNMSSCSPSDCHNYLFKKTTSFPVKQRYMSIAIPAGYPAGTKVTCWAKRKQATWWNAVTSPFESQRWKFCFGTVCFFMFPFSSKKKRFLFELFFFPNWNILKQAPTLFSVYGSLYDVNGLASFLKGFWTASVLFFPSEPYRLSRKCSPPLSHLFWNCCSHLFTSKASVFLGASFRRQFLREYFGCRLTLVITCLPFFAGMFASFDCSSSFMAGCSILVCAS